MRRRRASAATNPVRCQTQMRNRDALLLPPWCCRCNRKGVSRVRERNSHADRMKTGDETTRGVGAVPQSRRNARRLASRRLGSVRHRPEAHRRTADGWARGASCRRTARDTATLARHAWVSRVYGRSRARRLRSLVGPRVQMSLLSCRTESVGRRGSCSCPEAAAVACCAATTGAGAAPGVWGLLAADASRVCDGDGMTCGGSGGRATARPSRKRFAVVRGASFASSSRTRRK